MTRLRPSARANMRFTHNCDEAGLLGAESGAAWSRGVEEEAAWRLQLSSLSLSPGEHPSAPSASPPPRASVTAVVPCEGRGGGEEGQKFQTEHRAPCFLPSDASAVSAPGCRTFGRLAVSGPSSATESAEISPRRIARRKWLRKKHVLKQVNPDACIPSRGGPGPLSRFRVTSDEMRLFCRANTPAPLIA